MPLPKRKISAVAPLTTLPAGARMVAVLPASAEPDASKRVTTAPASVVGALLAPFAQVPSGDRPGGPFFKTSRATTDPNYVAGNSTLADIANRNLCMQALARTEFSPDGNGSVYVVAFDGDPARSPGAGMQAFKDDAFTGPTLPAKWVLRSEVRAFTPYTSVPAGYLWTTNQYASAYIAGQDTEQFFQYVGPNNTAAPAPTGTGSDAGIWVAKNRTDIPPLGISQASFDALDDRVAQAESDIADLENARAIPLSGTTTGYPVTGAVAFDTGALLDFLDPQTDFHARVYALDGLCVDIVDDPTSPTTLYKYSFGDLFRAPGISLNNGAGQGVVAYSAAQGLLVNGVPVNGGAAVAWQSGTPLPAGALTYNSVGDLFYVKQAIANPGTEPAYPVSSGLAAYYGYVGGPSLAPTLDYANEITDPPRSSGTRLSPVNGGVYQFTTGGTLRLIAPTGQVKNAVVLALRVPAGAPALSVISAFALDGVNIDTGAGGTARVLAPGTSWLLGYDNTVSPARLFTVATGGVISATGSAASTVLQIRSDSTNRTRTLRLDESLQLLAATAKASNNANAVTFQVNKYVGSAFQGGAVRTSVAAAQADYDALTTPEKAAGAELLINTVPLDPAAVAYISVELIYG